MTDLKKTILVIATLMLVLIGNQLCLALESSRSYVFTAYEQYSFEINASDTAAEDTQDGDDDDDWQA